MYILIIYKRRKAWFSIQKILQISKGKIADTSLKRFYYTVKLIMLHACESKGYTQKNDIINF